MYRTHKTQQHTNNPIKRWAEELNSHLSQEHREMTNKYMKRCSISLAIREMLDKTSTKYNLTPVRMAIINKTGNNKCWRGCKLKETRLHCWWECKLVQPLWKQPGSSSKI